VTPLCERKTVSTEPKVQNDTLKTGRQEGDYPACGIQGVSAGLEEVVRRYTLACFIVIHF